MRKVVLYHLQSLDGVGEEPGGWMSDDSSEFIDHLGGVIATQDDVLLGRGTYDYWVGYWPTSHHQPFADFINGTRKHVFTSSAPAQEWANSKIVTSSATEYVAELKQGDGGDIGLHGSIDVARSLLRVDLVDELRLVVAPVLAHTGRKLFDAESDRSPGKLALIESSQTDSGSLLLTYGVTPT